MENPTKTELNVYGIKIIITSNKEISSWIEHDYNYYLTRQKSDMDYNLKFNLFLQTPDYSKLPELTAKKYHEDYIVYESKNTRIIDFFGKALAIYRIDDKTINIYCSSKDRLYEIFCLSFESLLGEELDKAGFHRIHCLALEKNKKGVILLLPPGAGKTTLALKFLESPEIKVLSEDIVLFKKGKLYGLHFVWGIRKNDAINITKRFKGRLMKRGKYSDKVLINVDKSNLSHQAEPKIIILGKRILSEKSYIKSTAKHRLFIPLLKSMVLGLELQQSLAFFLLKNTKEAFSKANISLSRLNALIYILTHSKTYEFKIGKNVEKNYNVLNDFLSSVK